MAVTPAHPAADRTVPEQRKRRRLRPLQRVQLAASHLILLAACALSLVPTLWVLGSSFSADPNTFSYRLLPRSLGLQSFGYVAANTPILVWLRNSLLYSASAAIITVALSSVAAYGFSRFRFRGRRYGVLALLLLQLFPAMVALVAYYRFLVLLRLNNTAVGLILVWTGAGAAFTIWLLIGYLEGIPRELDEAARIDGASPWTTFRTVILPLMRPMLAVAFLFQFIGFYNDYLVVSILMTGEDKYTVSVGLRTLIQQLSNKWPPFAAGAVLASIPVLLLFLFFQRYLEEGLTRGAVKG